MDRSIERELYKKIKQRKKIIRFLGLSLSYVLLLVGSIFISVPFIWMFVTSLKEKGAVFTTPPEWIPRAVVTTVLSNKTIPIHTRLLEDGTEEDFIEIDSYKTVENEVRTRIKMIENIPVVMAECRILGNSKKYGTTINIDKSELEKKNMICKYQGVTNEVYALKNKYGVIPAGLEVIIASERIYNWKVTGGEIEINADLLDGTNFSWDSYAGKEYSVVTITNAAVNGGKPFAAAKIDSQIFKPATWYSVVRKVAPSTKIRSEIQYVDSGDSAVLTGMNEVISYEENELVKLEGETAEDANEKVCQLYTVGDKKFAIFKSEAMALEVQGGIISNIPKYIPKKERRTLNLNDFAPEERAYVSAFGKAFANQSVDSSERSQLSTMQSDYGLNVEQVSNIEARVSLIIVRPDKWVSEEKNVLKKEVKFLWENYSKALLTAIDPIRADAVQGFSILSVLLAVFGSIPAFVVYFINSLTLGVSITFLSLLTSCFAAYSFSRLKWKGRDAVFFLYLATMMIPGTVTMIPVFIVIKKLGWIDTYKALILPAAFSTFAVFMLRQFFLSIPVSLEEAAELDGSSKLGILFRVIIPLSKPALATLTIFTFQGAYNEFMWPLIVTNSDYMKVVQIGLDSFQGQHGTDWPLLMAASVIVVIPVLLIYIFNQKYVNEGIKISAGVKG